MRSWKFLNSMNIKRVAIVGAGAVGGYYGARLAQSGLDVAFLLRSDFEHVKKHGLKIQSIAGDFDVPDVSCARSSEEIGQVDLIIIAWKTTANHQFSEVVVPLLHEKTAIITLQNGLGNVEELARLFGAERVFGGLCFVCINRLSAGVISHTASGLIRLGEYQPAGGDRLQKLVEILSKGGIHCQAVDDLEKAQWMKLIWNVPFNGLAIAEGGVDTLTLLETSGVEERIRVLMSEVQAVAAALGHEIDDQFLEQQIKITWPMKAYRPSSMIDFVDGKEVEVDAIWRQPLLRAKALGVSVPGMEALLQEIENRLAERSP